MDDTNLNDASREDLIMIVKQLKQRCVELEQCVKEVKEVLEEKGELVETLTHQNATLLKKSAGDEETITVLINQLESLNARETNMTLENDVVEASAVLTAIAAPNSKDKIAAGVKNSQKPVKNPNAGESVVKGGIQVESATLSNAVEILAQKNEEIEKLEMKVRELTEVNMFYTAIVLHHDTEERRKNAEGLLSPVEEPNTAGPMDVASYHERVVILESERDALQRMLLHQDRERQALAKELQNLREELSTLELDLVAAERWKAAAVASSESPERSPDMPVLSSIKTEGFPSFQKTSEVTTPTQCKTSGELVPRLTSLNQSATLLDKRRSSLNAFAIRRSLPLLDVLSELRLWKSSKPKSLSEPPEFYQKHIEEMKAYEADRQRNFDEIERTRAELFADMNAKLAEQRREIQLLNERLAASVDAGGGTDAKKAPAPRSVKDATTSPILHYLPGELANIGSLEVSAYFTTGEVQIMNGKSLAGAEMEIQEEGKRVNADDESKDERILDEVLGPAPVLADSTLVLLDKEEKDVALWGDDQNVGRHGSLLGTRQVNQLETHSCVSYMSDWIWKLFEADEKNERLAIAYEEEAEVVRMLLQNRLSTAALAQKKVVEDTPSAMQSRECALEKREQELVGKVAQLKEGVSLVTETEYNKADRIALGKAFTRFAVDAICTRKPLWYVCRAYDEVVDAHISLLRTFSTPTASVSGDIEGECVDEELDDILAKRNYLPNGNNKNDRKDFKSLLDVSGKDVAERAVVSVENILLHGKTSLSSSLPLTPRHAKSSLSSPLTGLFFEERSASQTPLGEPALSQNVGTSNVSSRHLSDACQSVPLSFVEEEDKAGKSVTQHTTAFSCVHEHSRATSNGNKQPLSDVQTSQGYMLNSLDYLMMSRGTCENAERCGKEDEGAPSRKNIVDFFAVAPSAEFQPERGEKSQAFVAEFDPFA